MRTSLEACSGITLHLHAGGTKLSLEGQGFPISSFQSLAVRLFPPQGGQERICSVKYANATYLECIVQPLLNLLLEDSSSQQLEVRFRANSNLASCAIEGGCNVSLEPPTSLTVLAVQPSVVPYEGAVTVSLTGTTEEAGEFLVYQAVHDHIRQTSVSGCSAKVS